MIGLVLGPVVQKVDNAIHRINHYPANNTIGVCNTCPLDSDLSGGQCYPTFEQPGPEENGNVLILLTPIPLRLRLRLQLRILIFTRS